MELTDSTDLFAPTGHGGARAGAGRKSSIAHGGSREGAGRKGPGYTPPPEKVDYDKAKARSETAKADMAELDYKIKSKQYVERAQVVQVTTTAYASVAQSLRSIPDNLERSGVPPEVCEKISVYIDETLNDLAEQFEMLSGGGEPEDDSDE